MGKRRRQSRSKKATQAAKTRKRDPSPGPSVPPGPDPEDDDDDVDIHAFEELKGLIPDPDAREAFAEVANVAKGHKTTNESARSSASRMESLMF